jgi:5'-nucleotidase/UDP-sugar diphosphatase
VNDERAKHRNVIVAHGGDTLSPSLMSGFDRGKHIVALTNLIAPDIFVAGNHEFDFGRDVRFWSACAKRNFRSMARTCAWRTAIPVPGHQGPHGRRFRRREARPHRHRL